MTTEQITDTGISTETPRGATIFTAYGAREVKAYPVLDSEIDSIAHFNTLTLVFSSLGSALLSFAIGIWTNAGFAEKFTPEGTILTKFGAPALCFVALVSFVLAWWARRARNSTWQNIKSKTS